MNSAATQRPSREQPYFSRLRPEPGKRASWVMAVLMHVLLAVFLIYGIRWQASAPEAVSVDLVRDLSRGPASKPAPPPEKPPEPVPKPTPEPLPKVEKEEPPPPKPAEILRKAPDKPKPVKEKKTENKAPQNTDAITKALQKETERMLNNRVVDAAARVEAQLKSSQAARAQSAQAKGLADYLAKVRGKIRGNIVLPPGIVGNPESVFIVTQLPSGEVLSVKLKTPSGNSALDTAIERAILKSSPLPKPDDPALFERELSIKYRPLED